MKSKSILFSLFAAALVLFSSCCESNMQLFPSLKALREVALVIKCLPLSKQVPQMRP
jgi:hypothetical protein